MDIADFDPLAPPRKSQDESDVDSDVSDNESVKSSTAEPPKVTKPEPEPTPDTKAAKPAQEPSEPVSTPRKSSVPHISEQRPAAEEDRAFDFSQFLDQMRLKPAEPIARYVKSFLNEFQKKNWTAGEQVKIVADFRTFIAGRMRECPPFSTLDQVGWDNCQEGIEKLIMNRLYSRTFSPKMPPILRRQDHEEDLMRDKVLSEKLRVWGWIEPRHLDIEPRCFENKLFLTLACKQINKINEFRAPRDKCICVLNCSKVIWALIRSAKLEGNADSFLPILIYILLQAKPTFLVSNLNYVNRFRGSNHMRGETAYYLSMIASAVAFIEGLEKNSLSIEDEEYEQKIETAVKQEQERPEDERLDDVDAIVRQGNSTSVLSASAGLLVESLKSYASKIFEPDDVDTPEPARTDNSGAATPENPEELAAKQASAEEYRARQLQEKEFAQTLDTLKQMFPNLDGEVIEDVVREKGVRLGAAIDVCLSLSE